MMDIDCYRRLWVRGGSRTRLFSWPSVGLAGKLNSCREDVRGGGLKASGCSGALGGDGDIDRRAPRRGYVEGAFRFAFGLVLIWLVLLTSVSPAHAARFRPYLGVFCEPSGLGAAPCDPEFSKAEALAVDPATGDLLVIDATAKTVSRFKSNGEPDPFSALGTNVIDGKAGGADETPENGLTFGSAPEVQLSVAPPGSAAGTAGDIYVTQSSNHLIDVFAPTGAYLGQLTKYGASNLGEACGVTVDSTGSVYVGDYNNGVHKYVPTANPPTNTDNAANFTAVEHPCNLVTGSGPSVGALFVNQFVGPVFKLDAASGEEEYKAIEGNGGTMWVKALAVDPTSGNLLVTQTKKVIELNASGTEEAHQIGPPVEVSSFYVEGIAVDGSGKLYLARSSYSNIDVYGSTEPLVPEIEAEWTASALFEEATLKARFGIEEGETTYRFEYLTQGEYEANGESFSGPNAPTVTPVPDAHVGSQSVVSVRLSGLQPGTAYAWRVVATSPAGTTEGAARTFRTPSRPVASSCPNEALRAGPGALLPDCRGYEMVSPVDKNGGEIAAYEYEGFAASEFFDGLDQAAPSGEKLAYSSAAAFADSTGSPYVSEYIASRRNDEDGSGEWTTSAISPPERGGVTNSPGGATSEYKAFLPDLSIGWLAPDTGVKLDSCATAGYRNLYRHTVSDGTYSALCSASAEPPECLEPGSSENATCYLWPELQGYSTDRSHAVFRVNDSLTSEAPKGRTQWQLYEWSDSQPRLVSILPDGTPYDGTSSAGTEIANGPSSGTNPASGSDGKLDTVDHALSADGSRLYWTAAREDEFGNHYWGPLYVRTNIDRTQSPLEAPGGAATGTGVTTAGSTVVNFVVAAKGTATLTEGSSELTSLFTSIGKFVSGQPIAGVGIPPGTTVLAATSSTLTLSAPVEAGKTKSKVAIKSEGPQPFVVGQQIIGSGISPHTTITAVGAGTLSLSMAATKTNSSSLSAFSKCSEPTVKACTIPVSAEPAQFWTADEDGSKAIFSSSPGSTGAGNLYEYDLAQEASTFIAGESLGVLGASRDLSYLYFASEEAIAGAQSIESGAEPTAGKPNVYLDHDGAFTFLGTLNFGDVFPGYIEFFLPSPVASSPRMHVARVSADGEHLAFVSAARLTAYDNTDASSGEADREVYVFDSTQGSLGKLWCASCNPSGAQPRGANLSSLQSESLWTAAWLPGYQAQLYGRRPLLDSGRRLYFNSVDPLSPRDANGAQDVYQWEAPGSGDCTTEKHDYSAQNGGCVSLLSSGESPEDSEFVDASADGKDVFIRTESSLAPQDPGSVDIYDAREGGGEPRSEAGPSCEGDSCQSAPPAPGFQDPASSAFEGAGDLTAHTSCRPYAKRAQRLSRRAGRLRRSSGRVRSARQARRLRRKSARLAHRAQRLSKGARRCRRANRRAGR